jgi:hypothetical protein
MGYSKGLAGFAGYSPDGDERSVRSEIRKKAIDFSWQLEMSLWIFPVKELR